MNNFEKLYEFDINYGGRIAGVDEAGRGPWAGPVVAAAVVLDFKKKDVFKEINDSKKLSPKKREKLYDIIIENSIAYSIAEVSNNLIDEINILQGTLLAMQNAIEKIKGNYDIILIDGTNKPDIKDQKIECVKDGDAKSLSIAAASILAKVYRDRLMNYYDKIYPNYFFFKNKGYGTKEHIAALKKYGICPIHRKSYKPIRKIIKNV